MQLSGRIDAAFSSGWRGIFVFMKCEIRGWSGQGKVEWSSDGGALHVEVVSVREWLPVLYSYKFSGWSET